MEASQTPPPQSPPQAPPQSGDPFAHFSLADLEQVRLLLSGGSIIDWHQLAFTTRAEVDRFLAVQELNDGNPGDVERLERLRLEAIEYCERYLDHTMAPEIQTASVPELLLAASQRGKKQAAACVVLKIMHVVHHLAGRELLAKLPVADVEIFHLIEEKVLRVIEEMRRAGLPVVEFAWSRKQREAQILKLLAKRETLAAQVYDKLRFRLVAASPEGVVSLLRELCHRLIPFNYVVPGQSENTLLNVSKLLESSTLARYAPDMQADVGLDEKAPLKNEFSGPNYRVINFVADLPVRVDAFLARTDDLYRQLGPIVFVLTEFQIMDQAAAIENESGESSHERYKERQSARVRARLAKGQRSEKP